MVIEVNEEAEKISKEIMDGLEFPNLPAKPIILMIGGLQGSGKTMAIDNLKKELDLVVVSVDEIRQRLFDKKHVLSDKFKKIVKVVTMKILKNILRMGYSIAWDTNATLLRIKQIEDFLKNENLNNYRLIKIYFETSKKELIKRLNQRKNVIGRYKGTVNELEESIKKDGKIDKSIYDMVINTEELGVCEVAEAIKKISLIV